MPHNPGCKCTCYTIYKDEDKQEVSTHCVVRIYDTRSGLNKTIYIDHYVTGQEQAMKDFIVYALTDKSFHACPPSWRTCNITELKE